MNSIKIPKLSKSFFDLSHDVKTSFKMGYLIPSPPIDCVPGGVYDLGASSIIRFAPLVAPVMHRFDVRHEYFFVPKRILWPNWDKWITQTEVGGELPAYPYVMCPADEAFEGTLANFLGIPCNRTVGAAAKKISALPFWAYQWIHNEYYIDQNLWGYQYPRDIELSDGDNTVSWNAYFKTLRKRNWEHDYFTSGLPDPQKGDPVMIPIGSQRVIVDPARPAGLEGLVRDASDGSLLPSEATLGTGAAGELRGMTSVTDAFYDPNDTLVTEDAGEATSINDLRLAYALQRLKEKLMRGGSRLTEFLRVVFNVFPEDSRLQRPEYITGVKSPMVISEVLNTTGTEELPQGNMSGHGVSVSNDGYGKSYMAKEHGYIICITSVIPRTAYQNGIDRLWHKYDDPTEEYTPDMDHTGEQATRKQEIYAFTAVDDDEFNYMPRYAEYRTMRNYTTGQFQNQLKHWTDTRIFAASPPYDYNFNECNPDPRIFADLEGDHCYAQIYHKVKCTLPMSKYATPTY